MKKSSNKNEKPTKKHIGTYIKRNPNHISRVSGSISWASARGPRAPPGVGRARGSCGPRAYPKMLPPTLLIWFAFLFKYVSICFLVGFSCFLMTSSWFYMFFDDIFMLFEGAFDGWKAPLSCVCVAYIFFLFFGACFFNLPPPWVILTFFSHYPPTHRVIKFFSGGEFLRLVFKKRLTSEVFK